MAHDAHIEWIGRLAAGQGRSVSRQQLLDARIRDHTIDSLRDRKVLIDVFPGVYCVGVPALSHEEFLHACVLHAGPGAYPTHRSGAELRRLLPVKTGFATVTSVRRNVTSPVRTRSPLVEGGYGTLRVVESSPGVHLPLEPVGGFVSTGLTRTLVDLADAEGRADPERVVRRAWREAGYLCLLDADVVDRELRLHPRHGVRLIRHLLRTRRPVTRPGMELRSRSGELRFLELIHEWGLPVPEVNARVECGPRVYWLDFYWRAHGFGVETDGPHHEQPAQRAADEARRDDLAAHGICLLHIPNHAMSAEPAECRRLVAEGLAARRPPRAA